MHRYIAFLRAINVGGHNVKMEQLRALFEALGHARVETFIASGNVIFESRARNAHTLEEQIERHLKQALGYEVATFIRSTSELAAVANHPAFAPADLAAAGSSLYVAFLHAAPPDAAQKKLLGLRGPEDDFHFHERELYWYRRARLSESPLFASGSLEKTIGLPATMRNMTTVKKLAEKYPPPA
jgi:uncharacterized protein (DUF1697 family)